MSCTELKDEKHISTASAIPVESSDSHHSDISELRHADDLLLAKLGYKAEFKREFSVGIPYEH